MKRTALCLSTLLLAIAPAFAEEAKTFGKPLEGREPTPISDVIAKAEPGSVVRIEGTIDKVCQKRGCWLEVKQSDKTLHVTFEDYAFFVPTDSTGKKVVLEGKVVVAKPAKEDVAHLESEGAGAAASSTVSVEATGVEIR